MKDKNGLVHWYIYHIIIEPTLGLLFNIMILRDIDMLILFDQFYISWHNILEMVYNIYDIIFGASNLIMKYYDLISLFPIWIC